MPFPNEEVTPPVTKMYLVRFIEVLLRIAKLPLISPKREINNSSFQQDLPYKISIQLKGSDTRPSFKFSRKFFTVCDASMLLSS